MRLSPKAAMAMPMMEKFMTFVWPEFKTSAKKTVLPNTPPRWLSQETGFFWIMAPLWGALPHISPQILNLQSYVIILRSSRNCLSVQISKSFFPAAITIRRITILPLRKLWILFAGTVPTNPLFLSQGSIAVWALPVSMLILWIVKEHWSILPHKISCWQIPVNLIW